jgi:hypothetical protein
MGARCNLLQVLRACQASTMPTQVMKSLNMTRKSSLGSARSPVDFALRRRLFSPMLTSSITVLVLVCMMLVLGVDD